MGLVPPLVQWDISISLWRDGTQDYSHNTGVFSPLYAYTTYINNDTWYDSYYLPSGDPMHSRYDRSSFR